MPRRKTKKKSKTNKPSLNVSEYISHSGPIFKRERKIDVHKVRWGASRYRRGIAPINPNDCLISISYRTSKPSILLSQETFNKYGLKKIYSKNQSNKYRKSGTWDKFGNILGGGIQ